MSDSLNQTLDDFSIDRKFIGRKILESLHDRLALNFIVTSIAATLIFITIWRYETNYTYLAWYLVTLVIVLARLFLSSLYKKYINTTDDISFWKDSFDAGTLMSGAAWGFVASIIDPVFNFEIYALILLFCGGLISAAVIVYQASLRTYLAFTLPIAIPVFVVNVLTGNIVNVMLGIIVLCFTGILANYLTRLNKQFAEQITLQAQNEALISTLQQELDDHETSKQALSASEHRYQDIFDNAGDMIQSLNIDGTIQIVNQTWLNVMEYTADEIFKPASSN